MMCINRGIMIGILFLFGAAARGQSASNQPQIGYIYPAGAQQGTTVQITAGGQFLRGAADVYVSGEGVQAKIIQHYRPLGNLDREKRQYLQEKLKEVWDRRIAEFTGKNPNPVPAEKGPIKKNSEKSVPSDKDSPPKTQEVNPPDHPLLYDLDKKSIRELAHIRNTLFFPRQKQQQNRQIAEMVLIEIKVDADAAPGDRELRIGTRGGLTSPVVFQVGVFPEVRELEPNDEQAYPDLPLLMRENRQLRMPKEKPLDLPVLINGQIMPGDVDRFRFRAKQGRPLVIDAQARSLIPYLADAVPGWFQAALTLYDAKGREVAFADDYRFNPDPVLFYKIPEDGEYELEIRDSIYRGREDFVYRISIGEQPFITQMFPLGGKAGVKTTASIEGWNLSDRQLTLDTRPGDASIRQTVLQRDNGLSNSVVYAVDTLPECMERESNDTVREAQKIDLPMIVNGRIDKPGDVDVFKVQGRTGDTLVAEVYGRRLHSSLDSLLRVTDASGTVLQWNDDYVLKDSHLHKDVTGLVTHHADSYLSVLLPKEGAYYVHLTDSQHHGGAGYGYRLRISPPQPDFALRVVPSGLHLRAGEIAPVCVHVMRQDGFDGEIEVVLKDAPAGFKLQGGRIPAGRDRIHMTLKAPPTGPDQPVRLRFEGRARIGEQMVSHMAVPAEDVMQAFLYRHLVPSREFMVVIENTRWQAPPMDLAGSGPIRLSPGGTARVQIKVPKRPILQEIRLELQEPPVGITLQDVKVVPEGMAFELKAEKDVLQAGFKDNLLVEVFSVAAPRPQEGRPTPEKQRFSLGFLPAIPIEIVQE